MTKKTAADLARLLRRAIISETSHPGRQVPLFQAAQRIARHHPDVNWGMLLAPADQLVEDGVLVDLGGKALDRHFRLNGAVILDTPSGCRAVLVNAEGRHATLDDLRHPIQSNLDAYDVELVDPIDG